MTAAENAGQELSPADPQCRGCLMNYTGLCLAGIARPPVAACPRRVVFSWLSHITKKVSERQLKLPIDPPGRDP